jgi:hypothetical protein
LTIETDFAAELRSFGDRLHLARIAPIHERLERVDEVRVALFRRANELDRRVPDACAERGHFERGVIARGVNVVAVEFRRSRLARQPQ